MQRIAIAKDKVFFTFSPFPMFQGGVCSDIFQQAEKVVIGNWFF
jgi:hypothetical protein